MGGREQGRDEARVRELISKLQHDPEALELLVQLAELLADRSRRRKARKRSR